MDKDMINVDFNFGGVDLLMDEEPLLLKGSPSHESDSGISAGSSPTYSLASGMDEEGALDNFSNTDFGQFEDFDEELTSYLNATRKIKEKDSKSEDSLDFVYSPVLSTPSSSPVSGLFHDITINEPLKSLPVEKVDIPETAKSTIQTRSATRQNNEKPSASKGKQKVGLPTPAKSEETKPSTSLPAVKVIKVISAPSNQSKVDTEKQIYEAIDERNRKNAIQAKINREKKKSYVKGLEAEIDGLKEENLSLKDSKNNMEQTVRVLEEEVQYLKSVIANDSALSGLLKNIPNLNNVRLSTTFTQRKRAASHDHHYQSNVKRKCIQAGVCLHVKNDTASLEFCSKCSSMSQDVSDDDS